MLHVSFGELPRSGTQNQLARNRCRGVDKSQRILHQGSFGRTLETVP